MKSIILSVLVCISAFAKAYSQVPQTMAQKIEDSLKRAYRTPNSKAGKDHTYRIKADKEYQRGIIGLTMDHFQMLDMDGNIISSQDLEGHLTVVNFWFKECPPCIKEMPALNELVNIYKGEDIKFLSFSMTPKSKLQGFFEKHPFNFIHVLDASDYIRSMGIAVFPKHMVLDTQGIIRYVKTGSGKENIENLSREIKKLIK